MFLRVGLLLELMKIILVFHMDAAWEEAKELDVVENPCSTTAGIILVYSKGYLNISNVA